MLKWFYPKSFLIYVILYVIARNVLYKGYSSLKGMKIFHVPIVWKPPRAHLASLGFTASEKGKGLRLYAFEKFQQYFSVLLDELEDVKSFPC